MDFDNRFRNAMTNVHVWTQSPPCVDLPNTDSDARNAIVALQAQVQALHRMVTVATDMIARSVSPSTQALFRSDLAAAQEITVPKLTLEAAEEDDKDRSPAPHLPKKPRKKTMPKKPTSHDDDEDDDEWDDVPIERTKVEPKVVRAKDSGAAIPEATARKTRAKAAKPAKTRVLQQPRTLASWFTQVAKFMGVVLTPEQVLYQHTRFEQPKVILCPKTDAEHKKIKGWVLNHMDELDGYAYGVETSTGVRWVSIPTAALVHCGLKLPNGAENELIKAEEFI